MFSDVSNIYQVLCPRNTSGRHMGRCYHHLHFIDEENEMSVRDMSKYIELINVLLA